LGWIRLTQEDLQVMILERFEDFPRDDLLPDEQNPVRNEGFLGILSQISPPLPALPHFVAFRFLSTVRAQTQSSASPSLGTVPRMGHSGKRLICFLHLLLHSVLPAKS
jgi:hypothetical protein